MLDFDPFAPAYPPHLHDNDPAFRLHPMQVDPLPAYNPYSPPPAPLGKFVLNSPLAPPPFASNPALQSSFTFDPFADEVSSTSSVASERERELEVQRLRIEFLRRREWMRRVVAWVDGISHGTVSVKPPRFGLLGRISVEASDVVNKKPTQTTLTSVVPYSQTHPPSPFSTSSNSAPTPSPRPYNYTPQRDSADSPTLYY